MGMCDPLLKTLRPKFVIFPYPNYDTLKILIPYLRTQPLINTLLSSMFKAFWRAFVYGLIDNDEKSSFFYKFTHYSRQE